MILTSFVDLKKKQKVKHAMVISILIPYPCALENLFRPQIESFFVNRINKEEMA